jgi:hypothetical protein
MSLHGVSVTGSKAWALILVDSSGCSWSYLLKAKSELKKKAIDMIRELKNVMFLRVYDAGEKFALEALYKRHVKFEYSSVCKP